MVKIWTTSQGALHLLVGAWTSEQKGKISTIPSKVLGNHASKCLSFLGFLCGPSIWVASIWVKSFLISLDPRWVNWGFAKAVRFSRSEDTFKEANVLRSEKVAGTSRVDADLKKQGQYFLAMPFFLGGCCVNLPSSDFCRIPPKNADGGVLKQRKWPLIGDSRDPPTMPPWDVDLFWQPSRSREMASGWLGMRKCFG